MTREAKVEAETSQTAGAAESQAGTCSHAAEGPGQLASPTRGCHAIPRADFQVGLCCLTLQPTSWQVCPQANRLRQTTRWLCSASSSYLQFKTSVFTPWPVTEGCFPWKGSITAFLLVPTMCPFNFFFFSRKVCMLLFAAPSSCARGNMCFGPHGKDYRNISRWFKERLI